MLELRCAGRLRHSTFAEMGFPDVRAPMLLPGLNRDFGSTPGTDLLVFSSTRGNQAASIFCVEVVLEDWKVVRDSLRLLLAPGPEESFYGGGAIATGTRRSPEGTTEIYFAGFNRDDNRSNRRVLSPGLLRSPATPYSKATPVKVLQPLVEKYRLVGSVDEFSDARGSGYLLFAVGGELVRIGLGSSHPASRLWCAAISSGPGKPLPISLKSDEFAHTRPQMLVLQGARYLLFSTRHLDGSYRQACAEEVSGEWVRRSISIVWENEREEKDSRANLCYAFVAPSRRGSSIMISATLDFRGEGDVLFLNLGPV